MTPEQREAWAAKLLGIPKSGTRKTGRRLSHTLAGAYGMSFMATLMAAGAEPCIWWHVTGLAFATVALGVAEVVTIAREDRE